MTGPRLHWLLRLYPRAWRDRYGDELSDLIATEPLNGRLVLDVALGAAREHLFTALSKGEKVMAVYRGSTAILARAPSAYLPLAMSALALMLVLGSVLLFGAARQPDEGAAAHLFQLLVIGQVPLVAWSLFHRMKGNKAVALAIFGLQGGVLVLALFPVWYLNL